MKKTDSSSIVPPFHVSGELAADSTDVSAERASANKRKMIVVGAHPDDPETGCGGTMRLWADAGHEVISAYLTRGEKGIPGKTAEQTAVIRTREIEQACAILNARPVFLGQIDGACELTARRYDEVRCFLAEEQPDIVLAHWPIDTHRDHQVCSLLVYDAWVRLQMPFVLYYFEVMSGEQTQTFSPTDYLDIRSVRAIKHKACFVHKSQAIQATYEQFHGTMERIRGSEAGCPVAEAYVRQTRTASIK